MPSTSSVVRIDPEILGGTPCFAGTRVPIKTLFDYVEGGDTLDFFLEQFPSVSRAQAVQEMRRFIHESRPVKGISVKALIDEGRR